MPLVRIELIKGAISLVASTREDWSLGNGIAHYIVLPTQEWK